MKKHTKIYAALALAGALSCLSVVRADVLGTYDFTGATGLQASTSANFSAEGVTVGDITRGTNYGAPVSSAVFNQNGISTNPGLAMNNVAFQANYTLATAVANDAYFEFSVSADDGYEFDLTSITFGARRASGGSGPNNLALRSSLDGFSANMAAQSIAGTTLDPTEVIFNLGESVQNMTDTVVFRIYGYARTGSGGYGILTISADSAAPFTINGTVSTVPEPSAFATLVGVVVLGATALRRRRR